MAIRDIAFPQGTSIEVRDLFFNLPARRKFLRSDRSELNFIVKYVTGAALAFPAVRFIVTHGSRTLLDCPAVAGLRERIFQLFGKPLLDGLMPVDYAEGESRVSGFASKPLAGRADRNHQFFYVNARPIKDRMLLAALNQAFSDILEKGKSAEAFLFLGVPPSEVDVNVHPAKAEVRFIDSQAVFRMVLRSIGQAALRVSGIKDVYTTAPEASAGRGNAGVGESPGQPFICHDDLPSLTESGISSPLFMKGARRTGSIGASIPSPETASEKQGPTVLGQYLNMYIVAVSEEGLLVIDQHNAHERVLYEKYVEIDKARSWPRKQLLIPVIMEFSPAEALAFEENRTLFEEAGFLVEDMGRRSFALKEFPEIFGDEEAREVFLGLLEDVGAEKTGSRREKLLATMACKSAVKAGEPLPAAKMDYLVEELFKTSRPSLCPHGRPIVVKIDRATIDTGLGRK